ncbi:MAG: hypothetical protein A2204_07555 [Elusimicrobia bacterium RIFOXYA1_FULL_47_7]|nr:MAG: hypothetical protein A2278_06540 [Elusimicrobia bacterium RIFOXYA12_FULL_49_49]OGS07857.1 MAG: hypothetical protein A2204_07555 [Elusimicrobia bacterium RIFOXYA1_FULL_47_7]OGS16456.1 MAG: hypothetical protein A2251_06485 [Elusimicrobia bacterium RIFOXYA2_FULL_47_53]OGS26039.1 MAG: hypothetical protein A2339_01400 [Elusimicrobia bacterium RIFOXYB12_FULL_50_12]OGS29656.1 MAG: hypothetical protein A2323_03655 [Elusimicrobia bacterium RIFOXYB2_FULL_46_23]
MAKQNCWEFKKCGREPGGAKVNELGVCPAATYTGPGKDLNSGKNAGRICWAIAGTFCGGTVQGEFAQKQVNCIVCDFYKVVRNEEGPNFKMLLPGQKVK